MVGKSPDSVAPWRALWFGCFLGDFRETRYLYQGFDLDRIKSFENSDLKILLILSKKTWSGVRTLLKIALIS